MNYYVDLFNYKIYETEKEDVEVVKELDFLEKKEGGLTRDELYDLTTKYINKNLSFFKKKEFKENKNYKKSFLKELVPFTIINVQSNQERYLIANIDEKLYEEIYMQRILDVYNLSLKEDNEIWESILNQLNLTKDEFDYYSSELNYNVPWSPTDMIIRNGILICIILLIKFLSK